MDAVQELDRIVAEVSAALDLAQSGEAVALAGLEGRVEAVCAAISSLPIEQGRACAPRLLALVDALDAIAALISHDGAAGNPGPAND